GVAQRRTLIARGSAATAFTSSPRAEAGQLGRHPNGCGSWGETRLTVDGFGVLRAISGRPGSNMKELAQIPIFQRAGAGELAQLASIVRREAFTQNTVVFFQGDRSDKLYVILSGAAKVYQQANDGKQKIVGTLGPG